MKTQLFAFLSFAVFSAMAGSVKREITNIYPKTSSELQVWTNSIPDDAIAHVPFVELFEYQRRVDILWADYTNRLERIAQMREKRRVAEEKKAARSRAFEIRKKYRAKERSE